MKAKAIVIDEPGRVSLRDVVLQQPSVDDVVVDILWSGISTGTEKLLWSGNMPAFPGMGYPLVPGYEAVGRVSIAHTDNGSLSVGDLVFVPGAHCYEDVRPLFGASASRVIVKAEKVYRISDKVGRDGVLLALAATAFHALSISERQLPDLIIGHGVLGRLLARLTLALGGDAPTLWEVDDARTSGANGYTVTSAFDDKRNDYRAIMDASGDSKVLDLAISHMAPKGEVVLAGFYEKPLSFNFAPAFMREASMKIAAEFTPSDVLSVLDLLEQDALSLDGLVSSEASIADAGDAYEAAFTDPTCTKMVLNWRQQA
ncbi:MAG: chlorophyll synthesis pathway protein BchC [Pseudomonadota bacterium]